jgi:hypothetical protein
LGLHGVAAQQPPPAGTTPFGNEALNYSINWPSGLSLGEGRMVAKRTADRWEFELALDASLPSFAILDRYRSVAQADFTSLEFEKEFTHGKRKGHERTAFDLSRSIATRETLATTGGGKTEMQILPGAKDALAFLYFLRRELAQGRIPPAQTVYFGAPYQLRVDYGGVQPLRLNEQRVDADRLLLSMKGPSSQASFEIFFSRDAARTPVMFRAPFAMGTFSMELVR